MGEKEAAQRIRQLEQALWQVVQAVHGRARDVRLTVIVDRIAQPVLYPIDGRGNPTGKGRTG